MSIMQSLVILLAVASGVSALYCWDGDQEYTNTKKCNSGVEFCAIWYDYTTWDNYYFCDESNLCKSEGFKNQTYFGIYCCKETLCNDLSPSNTPLYSTKSFTYPAAYTTVTPTTEFVTSSTDWFDSNQAKFKKLIRRKLAKLRRRQRQRRH